MGLRYDLITFHFLKTFVSLTLCLRNSAPPPMKERKRNTGALCWARVALHTPGDVADQELVSTLGLAPVAGAPPTETPMIVASGLE